MNKDFICPKCGALNVQIYEEGLGEEGYGDRLWKKYRGYCNGCDVVLIWTEEYRFTRYSDIESKET